MSKNVSNEFKNIIKSGGPFYPYIKMTLSDGTELNLTADNDFLVDGDTGYSEGSESGFPLGAAISKKITFLVNNNPDQEYDYYYARLTLYTEADLLSGATERIQEGIFTIIDSVKPGDTLEITAYDDMYKSDVNFTSSLTYPVSAQQLLNEVCDFCDITLGSVTFPNNNFQIQQAPEGLTGRQVIGYIAQIAGGNAVIDRTGRLIIKTYNMSGFDSQETITAGEIETASGIHIISEYTEYPDIGTDNVAITGVSVTIPAEDSGSDDEVYVSGTEDYAISIDNPLIVGQEKYAADLIAAVVVGVYARPFTGSFLPDPTIEFMDLAYLVDTKDNVYKTYITRHNFAYIGNSTIENGMESPEKHGGSYYSNASDVYQKAKNEIKINKTQWEQAMEHLTEQVANASGLYTTEEVQDDGSIIYYMHNKPTLEESDMVWKMTAETITVSTDGGKTWNAGITINGEVIAKIINTIAIDFDRGVGGTLILQTPSGEQTVYMDANTGAVRLIVESLKIGGKTLQETIQDELQSQVGDLVIGNVNLQKNSDFSNDFSHWVAQSGWTVSTENQFEGVNSAQFSRTGATSNSARDLYSAAQTIPANAGEYYTASAYFYTDNADGIDANVSFGFWYYDEDNSPVIPTGQTTSLTVSFTNNRWVRHSITAIAPENTAYIAMYVIAYRNGTFYVAKPQIEKGNVVTDWKLAPEDTEDYVDNLIADLKEQIDGKIQTYDQTSDPSTDWNDTEKELHTGDLWYHPDQKTTKRWNGNEWIELQDQEAIDASELAKTKAQVFYTTPKPPYNVNDLWVQGRTGDIMRCKTARSSGNYVATDWEKASKYTDDSAVDDLDEALNQQGIFNRLTNDGLSQGIFLENGQLYLNGEYMEFDGATIGGWLVSGNQLRNDQTNFEVKIQAPTVYGTSGLSTADIIAVHDKEKNTWPFVVTSDGSMDLGDEFQYRPNGFAYDSTVQMNVGGWQIKKAQNVWGYNEVIYWDTIETQTNGIGAKGPWVIWGGWNGGASLDYVNNYKFVVSDVGDVYAQRFFDNGQQLLPIVVEVMHKTLINDFCYVSKSGYYLLACYLIRSVDHNIYVKAIQYRNDNTYTVALQGANGGEIDLYTMWAKMPD